MSAASRMNRPIAVSRGQSRVRVALLDPPFGIQANRERFPLSDIAWGYAAGLPPSEARELFLVSSLDRPKGIAGAVDVLVPAMDGDLRNALRRFLLYRRYARRVRDLQPDIVHSADYFSLAVVAGMTRAELVLTTPGSIHERRATFNPYGRTITAAFLWSVGVLRRRGALVLATSPYMARWWRRAGFSQDRVVMLPLPTSVTLPTEPRSDLRRALGFAERETHLLVVATLREENRVELALPLVARSASTGERPVRLHLVGDGHLEGMLRRRTAALGVTDVVDFHGPVPFERLPQWYAAADVLVVPRRFNATPRVAQEALCCGTPVVANRNESLIGFSARVDAAIAQLDFEAPDAPEELRRVLKGLPTDTWSRRATREAAESVFDASVVACRLQEIYERIASSRAGRGDPVVKGRTDSSR